MFHEPSGWWSLALGALGVILNSIQVRQNSNPRCRRRHTRFVRCTSLKLPGITFERRVERDDYQF